MIRQIINKWMKWKEASLVKEIQKVQTARLDTEEEERVEVDNPTDLPLLSRHEKYAVFHLDMNRCIKIFAKKGQAENEYKNLQLGAERGISPMAYEWGPNYVVMDYMEAPSVLAHLDSNVITRELVEKLIQLFYDLDKAGFMINQAPEDILILPDGSFKAVKLKKNLIDKKPIPKKMLKGLGNHSRLFLQYVQDLDKHLYEEWSRQPEFSEFQSKE